MLFYTLQEILLIVSVAIIVDLIIGDPKWLPHPVVGIGKLILRLEKLLWKRSTLPGGRLRGSLLTYIMIFITFGTTYAFIWMAQWFHPWAGYAVSSWIISTTIAIKGLKEAALQVYRPLQEGNLEAARQYVGYIVGRDTHALNEQEIARATVETVAENTVDAAVSPIFFALLGGAPFAMLYRTVNTLDSMVGYKNEKYIHFGWASAKLDDLLNWLPARLTGVLMIGASLLLPGASARRSWKAIRNFATLHPSPNSGIPESAVAGALGVELGGLNEYEGVVSERARMGWPLRALQPNDIIEAYRLLYMVCFFGLGGFICAYVILFNIFLD